MRSLIAIAIVAILSVSAEADVERMPGLVEEMPGIEEPITKQIPRPTMIGGQRDVHGCIGSAGFTWCASTGKCAKSWETPCPVANKEAQKKDETRCTASLGFTWCMTKQKCIQPGKGEKCPLIGQHPDGGDRCLASAGYSWCDAKKKCLQPWNEACPVVVADAETPGCDSMIMGVEFCAATKTCIQKTDCDSIAAHHVERMPGLVEEMPGIEEPITKQKKTGDGVDNSRVHTQPKEQKATTHHRVMEGGDGCDSMIMGVEFCAATKTCIQKTDCDSIAAHHADGKNNHQVGAGAAGGKKECMSAILGEAWCDKAGRCMSKTECEKL